MKLLIFSNRNVKNANASDEKLFGEKVNGKGPDEIRLAWAQKSAGGKWKLKLIDEPDTVDPENPPSANVLEEFFTELSRAKNDCVVYIHGFNKSFEESIEQSNDISNRYRVGVISFSWPSNPKRWISSDEYEVAKATAINSSVALDRTISKIGSSILNAWDSDFSISLNLLVHSLGNYVLQNFVQSRLFSDETRVFDNIIMDAPDVDLENHSQWTERMKYARRRYVTINEDDWVLRHSVSRNGGQRRLGNSASDLSSEQLTYFDLSDGKNVIHKHNHFEDTAKGNMVVKQFFSRTLHGGEGLPISGVKFDEKKNAYVLVEKHPLPSEPP